MGFTLPVFGHAFHIPNWSMQIPAADAGDDGAIPAGWTMTAVAGEFSYAGTRDQLMLFGRHRLQAIMAPAHGGTRLATLTSPVATPPLPTVAPAYFTYYFAANRIQIGDYCETNYKVAWYDATGTEISTTSIATGLGVTAGRLDTYNGTLTPPAGAYTLALQVQCKGLASPSSQQWFFGGAVLAFGWAQLTRHPWFPGTVATPISMSRQASAICGRPIRTDHCRDAMRRSLVFQMGSVGLTDRAVIERVWLANRGLARSTDFYRLASCPPVFILPGNPGLPPIFLGDCEDQAFPLAIDGWASDAQQRYAGTLTLSEVL